MTFLEALQEVTRASPIILEGTSCIKDQVAKFQDNHMFVIVLSAGALRSICYAENNWWYGLDLSRGPHNRDDAPSHQRPPDLSSS